MHFSAPRGEITDCWRETDAVKWGMARSIILAWILTIPISALIGYAAFSLISHILP